MVKLIFAVACLCIPLHVYAEDRDLIYTYLGPVGGAGFSNLTYSDWNNNYGKSKYSGYYATGGIALWVISKWLIGDFSVQYMYNNFKSVGIVQNLYYTMSGRIGIRMGTVGIFSPGIGMYFESPPSNRKFRGSAGLRAPLAFLFNTTYDSLLFLEGSFMYGWYGMGDRSTKMFYGLTLGFIYKVGRI
jgi:hypothetical protein